MLHSGIHFGSKFPGSQSANKNKNMRFIIPFEEISITSQPVKVNVLEVTPKNN